MLHLGKGPAWRLGEQPRKPLYPGPSLALLHNRDFQVIKELIQGCRPFLGQGWKYSSPLPSRR